MAQKAIEDMSIAELRMALLKEKIKAKRKEEEVVLLPRNKRLRTIWESAHSLHQPIGKIPPKYGVKQEERSSCRHTQQARDKGNPITVERGHYVVPAVCLGCGAKIKKIV